MQSDSHRCSRCGAELTGNVRGQCPRCLMQAGLETEVPILSVSLTPHQYQETEHHNAIFQAHFVEKGREAARAALMLDHSHQQAEAA